MHGGNTRIGRQIRRHLDLSITTDKNTSAAIAYGGSGLTLFIPTGSTITSITVYSRSKAGGAIHDHMDSDGNAVVITVAAGKAYEVETVFAADEIILVGDNAGTIDVLQKG